MMRSWLARLLASVAILALTLSTGAAAQDRIGPRVESVTVHSHPQQGDTYSAGNVIRVGVWFDEEISVVGSPRLELTVGNEMRSMQFDACRGCGGGRALFFEYIVRAGDYDPDGIGVASDALSLNGARVADPAGNPADVSLRHHAFDNDPAHKVNGGADPAPMVREMRIDSTPGTGDTYVQGETIDVFVFFDEHITVTGRPRLALTIGTHTRFAEFDEAWGRSGEFVAFEYEVRAHDHDPDGLSIPADALRLNGGRVRDRTGNDADTSLVGHAVTDHPYHKVDGRAEGGPVVVQRDWGPPPQGNDHTYVLGNEIGVYVGYNRKVVVKGAPTLALNIGSRVRQAAYRHATEGTKLYFSYTVQADDRDPDGLSIRANALRLNGGSIRDHRGVDANLSLAGHVVTNDPRHKVDGGVDSIPRLSSLWLVSEPRRGDTYRRSEAVQVQVGFDEDVIVSGSPLLELTIGPETRRARPVAHNGSYIVFEYRILPDDLDPNGLSIGPRALLPGGGKIRDRHGNDADVEVGSLAIVNDPGHKVDGGRLRAMGTLAPLALMAGAAATVDLSGGFYAEDPVEEYVVTSSDPDVARVSISEAVLTVEGGREGAATIEVTARNETGTARQEFVVTVVTDPVEEAVLEHAVAALGRSLLASVTMAVRSRFDAAGATGTQNAGPQLPIGSGALDRPGVGVGAPTRPATAGGAALRPIAATGFRSIGPPAGTGRPGGMNDGRVGGRSFMLVLDAAAGAEHEDGAPGTPVRWTLWGAGDRQSFAAESHRETGYEGRLQSGHFGVDVGGSSWLAGAVVTRSAGQADYRFAGAATGGGTLQGTLTSVQPYARWTPRRGTEIWGLAGGGRGGAELSRAHVPSSEASGDLSMRLAVVGARQSVASLGRVEFAVRGDVGIVRLEARGGSGLLNEIAVAAARYRAGVETSHTTRWTNGVTLTPFAEIGGRHDSGDGETGGGLEVSGGARFTHPASGFGLEARARVLALRGEYRERGVGVTALLTPGGSDGRGLSLSVTPSWGAAADGAGSLWRNHASTSRRAAAPVRGGGSVDARIGYGFSVRGGRVLAPFSEVGAQGGTHRRLRMGLRLASSAGPAVPLDLELSGERAATGWGGRDHRFEVAGALHF